MIPVVRIASANARVLMQHLFPGDGAEHGAVLGASTATAGDNLTFLVRRVFCAVDGRDYARGPGGYSQLRAEFVRDKVLRCAEEGLSYLAVHNHGGDDTVGFSDIDMRSHERGYPTLLQICRGPVGALVFARNAVAGDIWLSPADRIVLKKLTIVGKTLRVLRPQAQIRGGILATHDRQALLLGSEGQRVLENLKVGIVGAGGVGSLLNEYLARLGVGQLIIVDPDRIEESNFSRIVGSERADYKPPFWRKPTRKVDIAERIARQANPGIRFEKVFDDFRKPEVVSRFLDCDFLFLAADTMSVRLLFNQVVHQYLISGLVVGSKATTNPDDGSLQQVFSSVRSVGPNGGCLWCNGWITPHGLAEEAATPEIRRAGQYVDEPSVRAPSVITLNAVGAAYAANVFLFAVTGALHETDTDFYRFDALTGEMHETRRRVAADCEQCVKRLGAGGSLPLTVLSGLRRGGAI